jgi:hypothetical protein
MILVEREVRDYQGGDGTRIIHEAWRCICAAARRLSTRMPVWDRPV